MELLNIGFLGDITLKNKILSDIVEYGHNVIILAKSNIPYRQLNVIITTENYHSELSFLKSKAGTIIVIASNKEIISDTDSLLRQESLSLHLIHNS